MGCLEKRLALLALVALNLFLARPCYCQSYVYCGLGEYLHLEDVADGQLGIGSCKDCSERENEYMDEDHHNHTACKTCFIPNYHSAYYDVEANCSQFRNTRIKCKSGLYFDSHLPGRLCHFCTNCTKIKQFVAEPCTDKNTVCCPYEDMRWINDTCTKVSSTGYAWKEISSYTDHSTIEKHNYRTKDVTCSYCSSRYEHHPDIYPGSSSSWDVAVLSVLLPVALAVILTLFLAACWHKQCFKNVRSFIKKGVMRLSRRSFQWLQGNSPNFRAGGIEFEPCPRSNGGPTFTSV